MLARLLRGLHPVGPLVLLLHAPRNQAADRLRLCPAPLVVHGGQPLLERLEAAQRVALNRRALAEQRPREDGLLRAEVALRLRAVPAPLRDQRPVRQLVSAEDHVARLVVPLPLLWRRRALQPVVPLLVGQLPVGEVAPGGAARLRGRLCRGLAPQAGRGASARLPPRVGRPKEAALRVSHVPRHAGRLGVAEAADLVLAREDVDLGHATGDAIARAPVRSGRLPSLTHARLA
mmetsp:Transcript_18440/g.58917  ORF Transcript_18440/g.58917 Transcript_18440/m.58917 type:complete len:233 (-) Transcript_18440:660-1358(-)